METLIVFKIAEEKLGLDITKVREVTEIKDLVPVPQAPNFLTGLVNVRGEIVPVLSLKKRFGLEKIEESNVLLVVEDKGRIAGIRVDSLLGTKKIDENKINRSSEIISTKKEKDFFLGVLETEESPILILDLAKILSKKGD
ncbi:MAG: chemotaxis protein CheW [candidate division WOR-3 bacterium]